MEGMLTSSANMLPAWIPWNPDQFSLVLRPVLFIRFVRQSLQSRFSPSKVSASDREKPNFSCGRFGGACICATPTEWQYLNVAQWSRSISLCPIYINLSSQISCISNNSATIRWVEEILHHRYNHTFANA